MKKNILLGLTGSIACSKAEKFVQDYENDFNFKILISFVLQKLSIDSSFSLYLITPTGGIFL